MKKQYIDKAALVAEIDELQNAIAVEKKWHEDNSMWYNGINHGCKLVKGIIDKQKHIITTNEKDAMFKAGYIEGFEDGYDKAVELACDYLEEIFGAYCNKNNVIEVFLKTMEEQV